jgi:N-acetylglucosaminyldiphosphoundecaprenol N-acetyl-beta-D-mannosaminyltransferase
LFGAGVGQSEPVSSDFILENLRVSTRPLAETAARICEAAGSSAAQTVFTLNLDHVVKMRSDPAFRAAYARAGLITADGFPVVLAGNLQGVRFDRVAGSDLVAPICAEAARKAKSIYLFGSSPDVLFQASQALYQSNPGLHIAGVLAPPQGFSPTSDEARRCVDTIGASDTDLCFVALGAPKQELFADFAKQMLPNVSFVCIGAGLDFITGAQVRAPYWMRRTGLEWLWRVAKSPGRLLHRYLLCIAALPGFLARAVLVPQRH